MKGELFSMCQNVAHVYKQIVNWVQMYNNNSVDVINFLLT